MKYIQYVASKDAHSLVWHALNYELTKVNQRKTIFSLFQRHENELLSSCMPVPEIRMDCPNPAISFVEKVKSIEEDKLHSSVKSCFDSLWKQARTYVDPRELNMTTLDHPLKSILMDFG